MQSNNKHSETNLPCWITTPGRIVYAITIENGGYSDERLSKAFNTLYRSELLKGVWESLSRLRLSQDGWSYVLGGIVLAIECSPASGKRATRDTAEDTKIQILDRQKSADRLLQKISKTARDLVELLEKLEENGGQLPAETYSGLAMIEKSIEENGMASATCAKPFSDFRRALSSYASSCFPSPQNIISNLANAAENHPPCSEIFVLDPWLSSGQSSWKDYVRVLRNSFAECRHIYGDSPVLSDAHWHALVKAMIDDSITRQTVAKGLKEL